jgi:hypothetical protein
MSSTGATSGIGAPHNDAAVRWETSTWGPHRRTAAATGWRGPSTVPGRAATPGRSGCSSPESTAAWKDERACPAPVQAASDTRP